MKKVDEKFELVLFNMWMAGISARKVSKELKVNGINISHTTVARYYKKFEEEYRVNKDISHLYAIRLFDIYKAMINQQINEYEAFREIRDLCAGLLAAYRRAITQGDTAIRDKAKSIAQESKCTWATGE